ncbi:putative bifunctional diguanylate cyclase/phosphodiesterase [Qipengyuania sp. DGS5-3]|uniref:putative bifunctional diguanylate cyclase/phosphodiesterase n=1 Tax=Qipengyuania sp. DGS5-3 TaxID=3349632 RepID=UPI0036D3F910
MLKKAQRLSAETASAVSEIYRPITRGYFAVLAAYYFLMLQANYATMSGWGMIALTGLAALASGMSAFGVWYMRGPASALRVELLLLTVNLLVVANICATLALLFSPSKLIYFIIVIMLFALSSASFRQSVVAIAVAAIALLSFFPRLDGAALSVFGFIAFGATMAALSISFYLRKAISNIAEAKIETEEKLADARVVAEDMRAKSLSDSLTSLPNRRGFFQALRGAVRRAAHSQDADAPSENVWLILLDLDGFKAVNDVHGHLTGDHLLKEVAGRLELFAANEMHVSRMGGDEFNLILTSAESEQEVSARCNQLVAQLAEPYEIEGRFVKISCSIGCKMMDLSKSTRSQISHADYALMVAKRKGKNQAVLFTDVHAQQAGARYEIEEALRIADLSREITLVFQPQFDLETNMVQRAEVLARWTSPSVGAIEPHRFIKIAEESGLITGITLVVVEKALRELSSWPEPIPLSINLSSYDLISDPTLEEILALFKTFKVDPALVEFEVTETAMMADFEKATKNLEWLAELGFSVALDDFGTGYSNFSYLRALPIKKLKVDKSFIENPSDPMTEKVLSSLSGMARVLGVHCLLEGVESEVDLLMAKRAGAESVQGYLFGKPMSGKALLKVTAEAADQAKQSKSGAQTQKSAA